MKTMINFIFIFLLLIKITTASSIANPIAQPPLNGEMKKFQLAKNKTSIVEFSWVDSSENQIKLSDFRGKVVLLNLWASWCAPCRKEHKYLIELKNNENLKIIGINFKDEKIKANEFLQKLGNPYHLILSDRSGKESVNFGVYGIPETILVNQDLIILKKYIGPLDKTDVKEIIELTKVK